ncbi:hypothetical protein FISHEDRAFT_78483 [Fistulina hepatica ATCC 64428]|nr:hypothetical protein FISHEDRAFT_78483 [Fistulina hepatica ATCC 64428]
MLLGRLRVSSPQFARHLSTVSAVAQAAPHVPPSSGAQVPKHLYYVSRSKNGNLPVYSDQRQTRFEIIIKNVHGDAAALANDIHRSLFPANSPESARLKIRQNNCHLILKGGDVSWRPVIMSWLKEGGF